MWAWNEVLPHCVVKRSHHFIQGIQALPRLIQEILGIARLTDVLILPKETFRVCAAKHSGTILPSGAAIFAQLTNGTKVSPHPLPEVPR